jgi:tetratricopeptide (TPR) repeat protein
MTFRTLAAPLALAALLASLPGCAMKMFSSSESTGKDAVSAGNAAYEKKDYAKACQELSKADGGAETLARTGDACGKAGAAMAEKSFKAALSANAAYAPALEGIGMTAYGNGDLPRAKDALEAAAKAGGNDPRAAMVLGETYLLSGDCDKAQAAYQEALRRDPNFFQAKARLEASRLVCAGRGSATRAVPSALSAPSGATGASGSSTPSTTSPAGSPKEPGKAKVAPKTIDLNDI